MKRVLFLLVLLLSLIHSVNAQIITGSIIDAETGDSIAYASASYKGHGIAVSSNASGVYFIGRHIGWKLTFSAVGYKSVTVTVNENMPETYNVRLKPDATRLAELYVNSKKSKYSRNDNPAVELMKRVIAAKKQNKLENHDFYQYNNYEKLTLSINDIKPDDLNTGFYSKKPWLKNQVEPCLMNNKLILPLSVNESVKQYIYRKNPKSEKTIILGEHSEGINDLMETGEILDVVAKDMFTEVDIYDDQVRLLQHPFTSPIGKDAIAFYRFYIVDTVKVERDSCFYLMFLPNNQQDFGFRGELYINKDSTLHVRRVELSIPRRSDVNFIDNMKITQEYSKLDNGEWVLTENDMMIEMSISKLVGNFLIVRNSKRSEYAFDEISAKFFKGKLKVKKDADAELRSKEFWDEYRKVELTQSEKNMGKFVKGIQNIKGFNWLILGLKALIENFVETGIDGKPSKFDIGPVNTLISRNFIDGYRIRLSGQTTANLNRHLFLSGYMAHGLDTKKNYYDANLVYSFNKKAYLPKEFPIRTLTLSSSYDICSPSDKFVQTDKDNVFTAFKWSGVQKMAFYKRHKLVFEREEDWGLKTKASMKVEENEATGGLLFKPLSSYINDVVIYKGGPWQDYYYIDERSLHNGKMRTTELKLEVELAIGRTYFNTKQRRLPVNLDAPVFNVSHTIGVKGFMGGEYSYHVTEMKVFKRFWMNSWGKMDWCIKGGIQWSKVPYPLLIAPASNLSYIAQKETFNLVNTMEFLNDRYMSLDWGWDFSGKIFNRLPLIKHLKWREFVGFKMLWGGLSDKNNPNLQQNWNSETLMAFPKGCNVMDTKQPYMEFVFGVHNVFKLFQIQYVRRLNYLDLPTASKHGVRIAFRPSF